MNKLTYEEAHRLFRYDPESGKLFWAVSRKKINLGDEAGCVHKGAHTQYRRVCVFGKLYLVHRIIWLMRYGGWPKHDIDHLDGDGLNNRPENLRNVLRTVNQRNRRMQQNNTSGVNGVVWHKRAGKWRARSIDRTGRLKHLGLFTAIADAETAVREFQKTLGFTERHGT